MNHRIVLSTTGTVLYIEAAMMLIPLLIAMGFKEHKQALAFLAAILIAAGVGFLLRRVAPPQRQDIFSKEGFVIVAMAWLALSLVGALPFTISGAIPHYIDALFETVSGFTTTGATLLQDVEALSYSMQFWRCFTHWIGGMGILVFVTIISAKAPDRTMHILRAEMPGPTMDKIVPKARDGVKILYLIYIILTLLEFAAFLLAGMPIYDAIIHAMSTAGTGGFGMLNSSMAGYAPVYQWIVAFFMVLFAINFNLFFLIIMGQWRTALRSHELICFLSIIVVASGIIAFNIAPMYGRGRCCPSLLFSGSRHHFHYRFRYRGLHHMARSQSGNPLCAPVPWRLLRFHGRRFENQPRHAVGTVHPPGDAACAAPPFHPGCPL